MLSHHFRNLYFSNIKHIRACRAEATWERLYSNDSSNKNDLYEKLGLNRSASQSEIKKAYYDLTLKYHPDRNKDNEEASKKFKEVTEAYEVLGSYGMRKKYDKGMPLQGNSPTTVKTDIVEPEVKYQSFYDSRSKKFRTQAKRKLLDDAQSYENFFRSDTDDKNLKKGFEQSKGQKGLISIAIGLLLLYVVIFRQ